MRKAFILFLISLQTVGFGQAPADSSTMVIEQVIRVGIKHLPPFIYADETGVHGPIIDFWERIDREMGYYSQYEVYNEVSTLLSAVESGEVDLSVNPITVSSSRIEQVDFTQPFFITDTAVVQAKSNRYWSFLSALFSWNFLSAIFGLGIIILLFGFVVWLIEHRKNKDFRKGLKGIGDGFWWSAVTMTTIGYGDKTPKTPIGRTVAFVWMVVAVVGISGLTAGIASSLTTTQLEDKVSSVRDLRSYRVATLIGTNTEDYLSNFHIPVVGVRSLEEGFEMIVAEDIDYLIYDRVMIRSALKNSPLADEMEVMERGIRTDYYSFPVHRGNKDFQQINQLLVNSLNSVDWIAIQDRYGID